MPLTQKGGALFRQYLNKLCKLWTHIEDTPIRCFFFFNSFNFSFSASNHMFCILIFCVCVCMFTRQRWIRQFSFGKEMQPLN